jgi:hypothetical protein
MYFSILANNPQDDSAIRRISLPELYLCADACLILLSPSTLVNESNQVPPLISVYRQRHIRLRRLPRSHPPPRPGRTPLHGHRKRTPFSSPAL